MSVIEIFLISIILLIASFFLQKNTKLVFRKIDKPVIVFGALLLTILSLLVTVKKIGGTVMYVSHGWPHFFLFHQIKDVIDGNLIDKWIFVPGGWFIYPLSNFVFYLAILHFLYSLLNSISKDKNK